MYMSRAAAAHPTRYVNELWDPESIASLWEKINYLYLFRPIEFAAAQLGVSGRIGRRQRSRHMLLVAPYAAYVNNMNGKNLIVLR